MKETVILQTSPVMFKNDPVRFVLFLLLSPLVIGLICFGIWYWNCRATVLTVTNLKTKIRRGILSKYENEVWHRDIRNVQMKQSFFQRIFGVGSIAISSAGQSGVEIQVEGIPKPAKVKDILNSHRSAS